MHKECALAASPSEARTKWSAWGGSLLFHLLVLLLLISWFQFQQTQRSAPGEFATVGIVLKTATETGQSYVDSQGNQIGEASPVATPSMEDLLSQQFADATTTPLLPNPAIGPSATTGQVPGIPRNTSALAGVGGFGNDLGGKMKVVFFETEGVGSKFVFVCDHSASMRDPGGRPLRAAKEQLLQSLEPLGEFQQFNIIFYNDLFDVWTPGNSLPFATEQHKESAAKFVRRMIATGSTNHYDPLVAAIKLNPDVIFFLTDGEEKDALNGGQLNDIRRLNRNGVQINAVQFGNGPEPTGRNFLRTLTTQNGGQYKYINIARL